VSGRRIAFLTAVMKCSPKGGQREQFLALVLGGNVQAVQIDALAVAAVFGSAFARCRRAVTAKPCH
jgi:hypothetical protein